MKTLIVLALISLASCRGIGLPGLTPPPEPKPKLCCKYYIPEQGVVNCWDMGYQPPQDCRYCKPWCDKYPMPDELDEARIGWTHDGEEIFSKNEPIE